MMTIEEFDEYSVLIKKLLVEKTLSPTERERLDVLLPLTRIDSRFSKALQDYPDDDSNNHQT
jgi:hypothetical protein